jgi:hypothetical protein
MKEQLEALLDDLCEAYCSGHELATNGGYSLARKTMISRLTRLNLGLIERRLPVIPVVGDDSVVATSRVFVFVDDCIRTTEQQLDALEYEMEYA